MAKSAGSGWNFLRDNEKLRGVISQRISERGLSEKDISDGIGVQVHYLHEYLKSSGPSLTNIQIMYICQLLGIEVDLEIEFEDQTVGIP